MIFIIYDLKDNLMNIAMDSAYRQTIKKTKIYRQKYVNKGCDIYSTTAVKYK